jgi:Flp pilus assembly protein protease CpaA
MYYIILACCVLAYAAISDIRTREVPDWATLGFIAVAVLLRGLYAVKEMLLGLAIMAVFSVFMYKIGFWGGADAKLMMGLGALFGIPLSAELILGSFMLLFCCVLILFSPVYVLAWRSVSKTPIPFVPIIFVCFLLSIGFHSA